MDTVALSILLVLVLGVVTQIFMWIYSHLYLRRKLSSIPGPKSLPFIGCALELWKIPSEDLFQWLTDQCFQFKEGIMISWNTVQPTIFIRKPHQVEVILRSQTLIRKSGLYNFLAHWLRNGLITSTGDKWRRHRRLITPTFHFAILDDFADIISDRVDILNICIKSQVDKNPKEPVNIFPLVTKFTLDTVCESVMGVDMDLQRQPENDYVKALHRFTDLIIYRYIRIWFRSDFIFDHISKGKEYRQCIETMHAFTTKVINERRKLRQNKKMQPEDKIKSDDDNIGKHKSKAFLELLMDLSETAENHFTLKEIREQVDTFMFAAHDTTAIAISCVLFCLGNAPEVQKKVHEELDDVFGNDDKPASKQQLAQLKYLDRVIKEALRFYPSAPSVSRLLDHDVVIDNYVIPKGVTVSVQILHLHHDPLIWEDPETFDPDRFLSENSHGRHPYAYIPFSAGPRNCIGQKFASLVMKIALTAILRKWTVKSEMKVKDMKLRVQIVITPPNKTINLYFTPIKRN